MIRDLFSWPIFVRPFVCYSVLFICFFFFVFTKNFLSPRAVDWLYTNVEQRMYHKQKKKHQLLIAQQCINTWPITKQCRFSATLQSLVQPIPTKLRVYDEPSAQRFVRQHQQPDIKQQYFQAFVLFDTRVESVVRWHDATANKWAFQKYFFCAGRTQEYVLCVVV